MAYYAIMCSEEEKVENLNEAVDHLHKKAGEAWLKMNSTLFHHALKYETKLNDFLTVSKNATEALHDCIWTVMTRVMEDTGIPMIDGLGIAVHLVELLFTIPIHLAFHSATPMLTSFMLEVYASQPWLRMNMMDVMHTPPPPHSNQMAMDVLHEVIINNLGGASKAAKVVQPTACFSMPSLDSFGGQAGEVSTSDGTAKSPHASHTPHSPGRHSQTQSSSPLHHSQSS